MLAFGGVYQKATVVLNGEEVGRRLYGYSAFTVDLTGKLRIGEDNEIRVVADNTQTPNSRWYSGCGIYREVELLVGGEHAIVPDGVRIVTRSIDPAVLEVEVTASKTDAMEIVTEIGKGGAVVARGIGARCEIAVPNAQLWDAEHPNLYDVHVMLVAGDTLVDEVWERTGIRMLAWNATQGLLVNGTAVKLRGGCVHHDHGPLGACSFKKAELRRIRIMKEAGFNAIRSAHNPASRALLDACDKLGMYVMNETFDTWRFTKSPYDYGLYFDAEWEKDVTSMVMTSLNHPSVVMYSIGNEIIEVGSPEGNEISEKLHSLCKRLDPTRPTTNCVNLMLVGLGSGIFPREKAVITSDDVVDPYREEPDTKAGGSLFVNIMVTVLPAIGGFFARSKKVARASELCFDDVDIAGYNYGEAAYKKHHAWHPDRVMVSSETFPRQIARNWKLVEEMPFVIGDFMWTGWDYLGEAGVGVPLYGQRLGGFHKPYPCISAGCGSVDMTGFVDAQGVYAAVVWGRHEAPYIGVRPVNHTGEKVFFGQWRGTDAVNSWSWTGMAGRDAEIEVYSVGDAVELLQDGASLGRRKLAECKATFKTVYRPGELVAISYDAAGREIARSALKSAAEETVLTVMPEESAIKADGQDLAYLPVHITDPAGITKMLDERTVTIEVEGAGILAAVGSGNPWTEEAFTGSSFTTYQGRMLVIVRSNGEPGEIRVRVSTPGLESREVKLEAH